VMVSKLSVPSASLSSCAKKNSGQRNWVILTWCFTLNVTFHFIKQDTQSIIGGNLKEVDISSNNVDQLCFFIIFLIVLMY
jgi:hypothetical protein